MFVPSIVYAFFYNPGDKTAYYLAFHTKNFQLVAVFPRYDAIILVRNLLISNNN